MNQADEEMGNLAAAHSDAPLGHQPASIRQHEQDGERAKQCRFPDRLAPEPTRCIVPIDTQEIILDDLTINLDSVKLEVSCLMIVRFSSDALFRNNVLA